ncbi:Protein kinase domain-containing protein [Aphelenchoides besseyi]|nr:Protein kinase domain-containing protein [Aphelenchoides besseyi]
MFRVNQSCWISTFFILVIHLVILTEVTAIVLNKDSQPRMCENFICTKHLLLNEARSFIEDVENDETRQVECRNCKQCTASGYSVCLKTSGTSASCFCAQEIPRNCTATRTSKSPTNDQQLMNLCYQNVIRNPPRPSASYENNDVLVTIDQFWQKPYWRHMKLENLTLYYEFAVQSPDQCDGMITTVKKQSGETSGYLCTPSLHIELEEETVETKEKLEGSRAYEDYDETMPPEVQFERDVFDGASFVRFYYRIQVRRERQLSSRNELVERLNTLTSDVLQFDLKPNVTKISIGEKTATTSVFVKQTNIPSSTTPALSVRKVNIEHRPQTQTDTRSIGVDSSSQINNAERPVTKTPTARVRQTDGQHSDQGQLRLVAWVAIITLLVCVLLISATVIYRRCLADRKTKTTVTKQMNGREYRATNQDER